MMTIKDFAKKKKISLKAARSRLDRQVEAGTMTKKRGPSNMFVYYDVIPTTFKYHDPFNRCRENGGENETSHQYQP